LKLRKEYVETMIIYYIHQYYLG